MRGWYHQAQHEPRRILLYGDSAVVSLLPTITRCWTRIGQQRTITTPGVKAEKQWNWGVVNVVTGETLHLLHPRRNNVGMRRLLAAIARYYHLVDHPERRLSWFWTMTRLTKLRAFSDCWQNIIIKFGLSGCLPIHLN